MYPPRYPNGEYDIFDAVPYQPHSETSIAAAEALRGNRRASLEAKVYEVLVASGARGMTDLEIQGRLDLDGSTQRPRRVRLCEQGLVHDSGSTRLSDSRRKCIVWMATTF